MSIKGELFNGELFDLTITSKNNIYGEKKIHASTTHGITMPLSYFADELYKMTDNSNDIKFLKRMPRYAFVDELQKHDEIVTFFDFYINYLNGGDGVKQFSSHCIITVAGGNVITIFAKLLKLISNFTLVTKNLIHDIHVFIETYFNIPNNFVLQTIILDVYSVLSRNKSTLITQFEHISKSNFSDLDFSLLPNIIQKGGVHHKTGSKRTKSIFTSERGIAKKRGDKLYYTGLKKDNNISLLNLKILDHNSFKFDFLDLEEERFSKEDIQKSLENKDNKDITYLITQVKKEITETKTKFKATKESLKKKTFRINSVTKKYK